MRKLGIYCAIFVGVLSVCRAFVENSDFGALAVFGVCFVVGLGAGFAAVTVDTRRPNAGLFIDGLLIGGVGLSAVAMIVGHLTSNFGLFVFGGCGFGFIAAAAIASGAVSIRRVGGQ
ncbi:hypothetical protein BKA00_003923 [Actinomadura coerulea]|uniref:Uncharacterized protein n=1 Tax=Actinomadura coerulea TaxID=46159 RepID=A0A7X0L0B8_9ACTN|nr:hypothetical protein [Actinomadura coerulea]MBB6397009.1 hypothetical protein [Actinomadura coerulea]GGP95988.1 hypothetical protein GCM10010187_09510 [Actinomadura coerulea]